MRIYCRERFPAGDRSQWLYDPVDKPVLVDHGDPIAKPIPVDQGDPIAKPVLVDQEEELEYVLIPRVDMQPELPMPSTHNTTTDGLLSYFNFIRRSS